MAIFKEHKILNKASVRWMISTKRFLNHSCCQKLLPNFCALILRCAKHQSLLLACEGNQYPFGFVWWSRKRWIKWLSIVVERLARSQVTVKERKELANGTKFLTATVSTDSASFPQAAKTEHMNVFIFCPQSSEPSHRFRLSIEVLDAKRGCEFASCKDWLCNGASICTLGSKFKNWLKLYSWLKLWAWHKKSTLV